MNNMIIRDETTDDIAAVQRGNLAAFDTPEEETIIDALREQVDDAIFLVAEQDSEIVGNIVFSPVEVIGFPDAKLMKMGKREHRHPAGMEPSQRHHP